MPGINLPTLSLSRSYACSCRSRTAAAILLADEQSERISLSTQGRQFIPGITRAHEVPFAASFAHLRLSGLLAAGLCDALDAAAGYGTENLDTWARKPLDLSPGRSGSTATRIMSLPD